MTSSPERDDTTPAAPTGTSATPEAGSAPAGGAPAATPPETRDWSTVVTDGCQECGWVPFAADTSAARLRATAPRWEAALSRPDVAQRPAPLVWSPLEYANHSRDMVRVLGERVAAMLDGVEPRFADWDGDAAAAEFAYWATDPAHTAADIAARTDETVAVLERVDGDDWARPGYRSDGKLFTIATLCLYLVHDVEHHLHDVGA